VLSWKKTKNNKRVFKFFGDWKNGY
jgi:hypothetical protein